MSQAAARCRRLRSSTLGSGLQSVLELAYLVVTGAHRLICLLDGLARFAAEIAALKSRLELPLEIILAGFDRIDDPPVVAAGNRGLEIQPRLVGLAHERSVVRRLSA